MTDPCKHEMRIGFLEKREETLFAALKSLEEKLDTKLDQILSHIGKIAVLEESHRNTTSALERANAKLETLEGSVHKLTEFKASTEGMAKMAWILWGTIGGSLVAVLLKLFVMSAGGHG